MCTGYFIHMTEFSTSKKVMNRLGGEAEYLPTEVWHAIWRDSLHSSSFYFHETKHQQRQQPAFSNTGFPRTSQWRSRAVIPRVNIPIVRNILE